ncbi:two component, sigma54 specific, transcriptional regulator, Fis family [Geoalkalibacter ferrihydriticus]|uniref:Fis family transcriptional regulator n=2 Tax=Geoalkalibacter ferrihydriticus TaxID=392333 RepID=A0A0C2HIV9_9BACT|nr:sigma-54 dependent transcriptional regulator [Geoalkalibacter ferrihydriticus]KIH77001.1 Fis family transcriptional regulator [Geoalkalibacter ferrihydriticus DSM 17813]SDL39902.1 two component, sigma54 specific, transcriptional regulator, Fis family [Geoalkalibacter ferrihydriticus]
MEKILIVDDEAFIRENLERILAEDGFRPFSTGSSEEAVRLVGEEEIDLVLLDLNLGARSGLDVLRELREVDPEVLVIIITGYGTVESAVEALKLGAYDYIKKPFKADAIHLIVRLALETQNLRREVRHLKREGGGQLASNEMIGSSPQLLQVFRQLQEVAKHENATVLITGESGTGKELVARAIHNLSPRKDRPFVEINCGSLPFNLLETELFGHERGAFTDAKTRKIGLIEESNGGTVFLDEIGEMDLNLQVKLLRVLEDRKIRRLGGVRNLDIDVRVIAATNRDLKQAIEEKVFREDLFYRLNVFPIHVPPLRDRREDIAHLLDFFLKRFSREFNKKMRDVSRPALDLLMRYHWPGNVRELRNVVERICIMHNSEIITPEMLPGEIWGDAPRRDAPFSFEIPPEGILLEEMVNEVEKELIAKALQITGGNVAKTSRLLNVPRGTLRYKLEKYDLSGDE